jgi:hypothetical protein
LSAYGCATKEPIVKDYLDFGGSDKKGLVKAFISMALDRRASRRMPTFSPELPPRTRYYDGRLGRDMKEVFTKSF